MEGNISGIAYHRTLRGAIAAVSFCPRLEISLRRASIRALVKIQYCSTSHFIAHPLSTF